MGKIKEIPGYEGLYGCDMDGNVYSLITNMTRRKKKLVPYVNTGGYMKVNLYKDGKCKHEYVHRLIALTFIPNPNNYRYINHKDSKPANNAVGNLEWCTAKYNIAYSRIQERQYKDKQVTVVSVLTNEKRVYPNIRSAATDLFGKHFALAYQHKREGSDFFRGEWRIHINDERVHTV